MPERIISSEVLQQRADAIILGMRKMVSNGFDPSCFKEFEPDLDQRKHRDMIQVYLGIKPCASYLFGVLDSYYMYTLVPSDDNRYLKFFPEAKDTGVTVLEDYDSRAVWNPHLVSEVLEEHQDLKVAVPSPYDKQKFGNLLDRFYNCRGDEDILLHGVILGYPRIAVEMFKNNYGIALDDAQKIWEKALTLGIDPETCSPSPVVFDLNDGFGIDNPEIRDEFVRLAGLVKYPNNDVINYVRGLRAADIPGWPFFTSGDLTLVEEERMREQYAASQFDNKFTSLLDEFGV